MVDPGNLAAFNIVQSSFPLFASVAKRDFDTLASIYTKNAKQAVVSFLSMRNRWASMRCRGGGAEEKLDEFLQHFSAQGSPVVDHHPSRSGFPQQNQDVAYHFLLEELSAMLERDYGDSKMPSRGSAASSHDADDLLWDSAVVLSNSRPPANFVVYSKDGELMDVAPQEGSPIFDGSVANSTPPPLGGAGAASGAGTILHLACAVDSPLALALFLVMGADARSPHTAFRRLMTHEVACNGSAGCLTLLMELGEQCAKEELFDRSYIRGEPAKREASLPLFPDAFESNEMVAPPSINIRHNQQAAQQMRASMGAMMMGSKPCFLSVLRLFRNISAQVKNGNMTELDAARMLLQDVGLSATTKAAIARSCTFTGRESGILRSFVRPQGCSDGHGNTPLHWAAFKNETECVSLLLRYGANPNARAHPSGWTPLHDAAYSNSSESIELLISSGAQVDVRANSGATPLCFAAQEDAADAAKLLLDRGADLCTRCAVGPNRDDGMGGGHGFGNHPHSRFSGYTPLHYCAHYNAHKAARVLLGHISAGTAMEIQDLSDRLPIHVAVARGSSDVLRELLHAGARVETQRGALKNHPSAASPTPMSPPRSRPVPERPSTPRSGRRSPASPASVSSPVLRSMIPSQPVTSTKPWNCLTQRSIDECRALISQAEKNWAPDRHILFTPADRRAVVELLRVGKRLEQNGSGIFVDLWPLVLSFCGRGWFEVEDNDDDVNVEAVDDDCPSDEEEDHLMLPALSHHA